MRKFISVGFILINLLVGLGPGVQAWPLIDRPVSVAVNGRDAVESITAAEMREHLYYIASDEMEGRDTPSRGLDLTARFIAMNLALWGVKPAGENGTYFQPITLRREKVTSAQTRGEFGGKLLKYNEDFYALPVAGNASGSMVYVGNGWVFKEKNIDAYKGIDVKDKIIIYRAQLPRGISIKDIQSGKPGVDWIDPFTYAKQNGARGLIAVPRLDAAADWEKSWAGAPSHSPWRVEKFPEAEQAGLPMITASPGLLESIFAGEKVTWADVLRQKSENDSGEPFALNPDKKAAFTVTLTPEVATTRNVIGVIEGSDLALKGEYVAIGAHYDHVGVGQPVNGDAIYNGADDDGSGTVATLALAKAFATRARPKRSMLFVWHTAEEHGLWGARYFTMFPTVPLDKVVAQLNIDMIGRSKKPGDTNPENKDLNGPHEIYVVGSKMMSTELGELSERVNRSYLNLKFNYKYDDPKDPERLFFRSDHYHYARNGIPIIFYTDGPHEDYHKPSDTADKIDYQLMEKVTRTIYMTALELSTRPTRPRVDKKLPADM